MRVFCAQSQRRNHSEGKSEEKRENREKRGEFDEGRRGNRKRRMRRKLDKNLKSEMERENGSELIISDTWRKEMELDG